MKFVFVGKAVPKSRPRFCKNGMVVDVQAKQKRATKLQTIKQIADMPFLSPLQGSISIEMTVHTAPPRKTSQKALKSIYGKPDTRRPDLDNYVKFYLDCMNGLVYEDDAQVTNLFCKKIFSDTQKVEIIISQADAV